MLITPEKIEMWKQSPAKWDYDRGYHKASLDVWNQPEPMIFTEKDSKSFRLGYKCGWAEQKAHLEYDGDDEKILNRLISENFDKVCEQTQNTEKVSGKDVPDYSEDDYKDVMSLFEHPELVELKRRVYHKNGMTIREDYD